MSFIHNIVFSQKGCDVKNEVELSLYNNYFPACVSFSNIASFEKTE